MLGSIIPGFGDDNFVVRLAVKFQDSSLFDHVDFYIAYNNDMSRKLVVFDRITNLSRPIRRLADHYTLTNVRSALHVVLHEPGTDINDGVINWTLMRFDEFISNSLGGVGRAFKKVNDMADRITKKPDYEKYKVGDIVYKKVGTKRYVDTAKGAGKIIHTQDKVSSYNDYVYSVDFINYGVQTVAHRDLIPSRELFDYIVKMDSYESLFDCGILFNKGERFILIDGYLHNRTNDIILNYSKFKDKFKEYVTLPESTSKTEKIPQPPSDISGF